MKALLVVLLSVLLFAAVVRAEEVDDSSLVEHDEVDQEEQMSALLQTGEVEEDEDEDVADEEDEQEEEADEEVDAEFEEESFAELEAGCQCSREQTATNEGKRLDCYYDTKRIPTIGIGFNLKRGDAQSILTKAGVKTPLATILKECGKKKNVLTTAQMNTIFAGHYDKEGVSCAKKILPGAPKCVLAGLADMALNLGCPGLNKFKNMIAKLQAKQWAAAAQQAKQSAWYKQVGTRGPRTSSCLATGK